MPISYVEVAGQQFSTELLGSVTVRQALNEHWECSIVFRSTLDQRPDLEAMQGKPLKMVTYDLFGSEHIIFSGLVVVASVRYEVGGSFGGIVQAVSACWAMSRARRFGYFLKQAPQDIAQQITGNAGLDLAGTLTGDSNASRVQWQETDYDFLLQLADDAEAWVRPTKTGLEVQTSFQPGPTVVWREGEDGLLEFSTGGLAQAQTLSGTHYDPATMESKSFSAVQSDATFYGDAAPAMVKAAIDFGKTLPPDEQGNRQRSVDLADFNKRLQLESRRRAANAVVCRGVSREMQVTAGDEITIVGLPDGSGTYGVIACNHEWTKHGYRNSFVATPAKRWFAATRPPRAIASGMFPARIAANYDPHDQGRVQVNYPWLTGAPTTWARLLMPHAGADRGFMFFPELGDEVAVRFEGGDPERPVVIGSAWNGVQQPPTEGFWHAGTTNGPEFKHNYIKRFVTKSGIRITLNDTPGQETIHLATPVSNQLFMTDKANETGRPSISLHTTGDIISHATGRIHTKAKTTSRHAGDKVAVAAIAAPFDCKGEFKNIVDKVNALADMKDPFERNKLITAAYAQMYLDDNDLQWAGLGAVVSRNAGCGMVKAASTQRTAEEVSVATQLLPIIGPIISTGASGEVASIFIANAALADTNQLIFRTVAPTMMFIAAHKPNGAQQLLACIKSGSIKVEDHLKDPVANSKIPNSSIPPELISVIGNLADAERLPHGDARSHADSQAADRIAVYEQQRVVQERIYDSNPLLKGVMKTNQEVAKYPAGREIGAVAPEIAFSANCDSTSRIKFDGSINDKNDRVAYYYTVMDQFRGPYKDSINSLEQRLAEKPEF